MPQLSAPLIDQVMELVEQGYPNNEVMAKLQEQGFSNTEIQEALSQAQTKASVESSINIPPPPPMPHMQPSLLNREPQQSIDYAPQTQEIPPPREAYSSRDMEEKIEEIAESIIEEKWQRAMEEMGDLTGWKEKIKTEIVAIKQEVLRIENRFEGMQQAMFGRIKEYDKQMGGMGTDVKAIEKLLENILRPLTDNIKELKRITEKMQK